MTSSTKAMLFILFSGCIYESTFNQNYEKAFEYCLICLIVIIVWYNETKKHKI